MCHRLSKLGQDFRVDNFAQKNGKKKSFKKAYKFAKNNVEKKRKNNLCCCCINLKFGVTSTFRNTGVAISICRGVLSCVPPDNELFQHIVKHIMFTLHVYLILAISSF